MVPVRHSCPRPVPVLGLGSSRRWGPRHGGPQLRPPRPRRRPFATGLNRVCPVRAVWTCVRSTLRDAWRSWAAVALVIGLVGGMALAAAAGRRAWQVFIERLGAQATVAVPLAAILLAVPAVVIAANLIAVGPGWVAG